MKSSVKVQKLYSLEEIPESELSIIEDALNHYINEIDDSQEVINVHNSILNLLHGSEDNNDTQEERGNTTFDGRWSLKRCLEELEPFGKGFVPRARLPQKFFSEKDITCLGYLYGEQGQLGLSYWKDIDDCIDEKQPNIKLWLNKHCANLIMDFINTKGDTRFLEVSPRKEGIYKFILDDCYLNSKGNLASYEKKLKLIFDRSLNVLTIYKDDIAFTLNSVDTVCLHHFYNWHKENIL